MSHVRLPLHERFLRIRQHEGRVPNDIASLLYWPDDELCCCFEKEEEELLFCCCWPLVKGEESCGLWFWEYQGWFQAVF